MVTTLNVLRQASREERAIINRLLEADFPGKAELAKLLENCEVATIDEMGA